MGLVLFQKIFDAKNIHYGFWEDGTTASLKGLPHAQEKYTNVLISKLEEHCSGNSTARILDVGCGVGENIRQLRDKGYTVEGIVPSALMAEESRKRSDAPIYECRFEDFAKPDFKLGYDLIFFSESFQYVNMEEAFDQLNKILNPNGKVVIFDFFKRDGVQGRSLLGGGHSIGRFYEVSKKKLYSIIFEQDYTQNMAPNLDLVSQMLTEKIIPAAAILDQFLLGRYNILYRFIKFLFRKRLKKFKHKYSQHRDAQDFEKYKIYKLIVLGKL